MFTTGVSVSLNVYRNNVLTHHQHLNWLPVSELKSAFAMFHYFHRSESRILQRGPCRAHVTEMAAAHKYTQFMLPWGGLGASS